jgi:hypothetical protein
LPEERNNSKGFFLLDVISSKTRHPLSKTDVMLLQIKQIGGVTSLKK